MLKQKARPSSNPTCTRSDHDSLLPRKAFVLGEELSKLFAMQCPPGTSGFAGREYPRRTSSAASGLPFDARDRARNEPSGAARSVLEPKYSQPGRSANAQSTQGMKTTPSLHSAGPPHASGTDLGMSARQRALALLGAVGFTDSSAEAALEALEGGSGSPTRLMVVRLPLGQRRAASRAADRGHHPPHRHAHGAHSSRKALAQRIIDPPFHPDELSAGSWKLELGGLLC